ncbi:MAG: hypothetical protein RLZZ414_1826 [Bacteroidota bacterium]|jgi:hypothetical protein
MNYLEIVLHGYFNENNREFLDKYFFREFKKAEKEHFFEADEFFNGCLKIVDILKENYKKQYIEIQSELNKYLVSVKKEDRDNEFIQQQKEEIEYLKLNGNTNFRLNNGKNVVLKIEEISYIQNAIEQALKKTQPEIEHSKPQPIIKQKSEQNIKLITFKNSETIEKIHTELKGYFPKKEAELLKALQGEQLSEILLFPHNQNKFVEVFRRLKYNGFLLNTDTETKNWICTTFQFIKKGFAEPQPFNEDTVWNNLNKGKGEPTKKERICITDWLPYKNPKTLEEEVQKEKR